MKLAITTLLLAISPQEGDLAKRLRETYVAAADALVAQQDAEGAWRVVMPERSVPSVAYTSLLVTALSGAPPDLRAKYKASAEKALAFLLSKANRDGSFGEGEYGSYLKTYATALALSALSTADRTDKILDSIRGAQAYLKRNQLQEGPHKGGLGYGEEELKRNPETGAFELKRSPFADLSATAMVAQAMKDSGLSFSDEFWPLAAEFVRRCHNSTEVNTDPVFLKALKDKGMSLDDNGSLIYTPVADGQVQKAGTRKIADRETIVGYGSMTYAGIKTYLYAGLRKDSPEVKAALDWIRRNYSIDSHPGFPQDRTGRQDKRGIYYYYLMMARALDAVGDRPLITPDGKEHDWPVDLAEQLLKTVRDSKAWQNDNPAWYEGDSTLVTGYVLNVCDILFHYIQ